MERMFNLVDEPWILVRKPDCTVEEVSLKEALLHAHLYESLAGELPTQDVAVLRLLLAVVYTVFSRVDPDGAESEILYEDEALNRWRDLWEWKQFPEQPISDYLEQWRDRFWLFDDKYPFWQVPEAKERTREPYGTAKLNGTLLESGNKVRLFSSTSGESKNVLSFAEAARWLLAINLWDDVALKPTQAEKTARKARKAENQPINSASVGWLGKTGYVEVVGNNLFETLALNLTFLKNGNETWDDEECVPVWEKASPKTTELDKIVQQDNPAAFLTLQFRRILLLADSGKVKGYYIYSGDLIDEINCFTEQNTLWKSFVDKSTG